MIELQVDAAPADALLACVSALRRLGGRITRYDIEEHTLEAWLPGSPPGRLQLSASEGADGRARLTLSAQGLGWWRRRRLRAALTRASQPSPSHQEDHR
jgi:hypothetical protein